MNILEVDRIRPAGLGRARQEGDRGTSAPYFGTEVLTHKLSSSMLGCDNQCDDCSGCDSL